MGKMLIHSHIHITQQLDLVWEIKLYISNSSRQKCQQHYLSERLPLSSQFPKWNLIFLPLPWFGKVFSGERVGKRCLILLRVYSWLYGEPYAVVGIKPESDAYKVGYLPYTITLAPILDSPISYGLASPREGLEVMAHLMKLTIKRDEFS